MNKTLVITDLKVEIREDTLQVTHMPTGMSTEFPVKLLHKWLITMLRKAIPHA